MKRALKWIVGVVVGVGLIAGVTFAFLEGRKEMAREREREKPVKTPARTSRTSSGEVVLKLDTESRERVGIKVAPLESTTRGPEVKAFGVVLDPGALVALEGELVAAEVALTNSRAEYERTKGLFENGQNTSRRALDVAEAQERTDAAKLLNAQQRWTLATAEAAGGMNGAEREQFVSKLVRRELALLRVEVPPGEKAISAMEGRVVLQPEETETAPISSLYAAPAVDEKTRGQAFLALVEKAGPRMRPGAAVIAYLRMPGERSSGVTVPTRATVRAAGLAWAYVQTGQNEFTRREVSTSAPVPGGWFVIQNFKAGDQVVVAGAQVLLSEEFKSQISVGDEVEKR